MGVFENPECPECGSEEVIPIVYGLPRPEIVRKAVYGEVILGGSTVHEDAPDLFCCSCGARWNHEGVTSTLED
jgi:hypothetical protein